MKLQQNQIWKQGNLYIRIVHRDREAVDYKLLTDPATKTGKHLHATKKEFCRLLKGATLMSQAEMQAIAAIPQPIQPPPEGADATGGSRAFGSGGGLNPPAIRGCLRNRNADTHVAQ